MKKSLTIDYPEILEMLERRFLEEGVKHGHIVVHVDFTPFPIATVNNVYAIVE
jgi:hypothetical protein